MIIGIGTDICENERIRKMYKVYNKKFLGKIYLPDEIDYCESKKDPVPHLAARFALKEAFIKAISYGTMQSYKEVGLVGKSGKKDLIVMGDLKIKCNASLVNNLFFSISHADNYSTAIVVLEK